MIGDSIMKGFGLEPDEAWPELLGDAEGWDVTNLACNGAGFLQPGGVGGCATTFGGVVDAAADLSPDSILISGSSNDFGLDDVRLTEATSATVAALHAKFPAARIIGISTIWGDTLPPDQLADTNEQVRTAVAAVGGTFIDVGQPLDGHRELLLGDDVHPTSDGQAALAAAIRARIDEVDRAAAQAAADAVRAAEEAARLAQQLATRAREERELATYGIAAF